MFEKLTSPLREFGLLSGLIYMADRGLARLSPGLRIFDYDLMVQPVPDEPIIPARFSERFEIREIKRADPELDRFPVPAAVIASRFEQSAICLGAFKGGEFIGYIWFCFRAYDEDEVRCTFEVTPEDEAVFDFDVFLFPEHRLGLGFAAIWDGANRFLRERGIRMSFSRVSRFNVASRRAHDRLGWKRVGRAVFFRVWRLQVMASTVSPYFHVCLENASRPRLRLRSGA